MQGIERMVGHWFFKEKEKLMRKELEATREITAFDIEKAHAEYEENFDEKKQKELDELVKALNEDVEEARNDLCDS
jgi:chaperonin cofactor prefoldin